MMLMVITTSFFTCSGLNSATILAIYFWTSCHPTSLYSRIYHQVNRQDYDKIFVLVYIKIQPPFLLYLTLINCYG